MKKGAIGTQGAGRQTGARFSTICLRTPPPPPKKKKKLFFLGSTVIGIFFGGFFSKW